MISQGVEPTGYGQETIVDEYDDNHWNIYNGMFLLGKKDGKGVADNGNWRSVGRYYGGTPHGIHTRYYYNGDNTVWNVPMDNDGHAVDKS